MNEKIERQLLSSEIDFFDSSLMIFGAGILHADPENPVNLATLTLIELRQLHCNMRDTLRTISGLWQQNLPFL